MEDSRSLPPDWDVSRETTEKLHHYADALATWTKSINLIAPATITEIWERHILDSAQVFPLLPTDRYTIADLGSGGGLPGIVLSILTTAAPDAPKITLIESDARKSVFLRRMIGELNLNAKVLNTRIEKAPPQDAGIVTARALAPLPRLLHYVEQHLAPDGTAFLMKGASVEAEIEDAKQTWTFDCTLHPSISNPSAKIVELRGIHRA